MPMRRAKQLPAAPSGRPPHQSPPQEVRVIGGQWKRSKLPVANQPGLRPTPNRVRETLFNWLGQDLTGWRCLDLFAGSGALGFEAASRGAIEVVLIERDGQLVRSLRETQSRLRAEHVRIEAADGLIYLRQVPPGHFDLIFIDPPFEAQLFMDALTAAKPALAGQGLIYLEADQAYRDDQLNEAGWQIYRSGRAGAVYFHLLQRRI